LAIRPPQDANLMQTLFPVVDPATGPSS